MHRYLSQKFRFFTFVCIALLLLVHGYNLNITYLAPFTITHEELTFTTFFEYFLANGLLRFRIPMLFAISGYIFAFKDNRSYGVRVKRRARTLLLPYILWSAFGLALTFVLQQFPLTAEAVYKSALDQLGDNRPYSQIGWWGADGKGILYRWLLSPPSFQLWFIRSLFIYNLLYPVFKWCVLKAPAVSFCCLFIMWATLVQLPLIEGQGMFFFALGIWLQKSAYPIERVPAWFSATLTWLIFVGLSVIRTFMAFEFEQLTPSTYWALTLLHILATVAGILAVWFTSDKLVQWAMHKRWFVWASDYSFFIYGFHIPLLSYLTAFFFIHGSGFQWYRFTTYILTAVLVLLISIAVGTLVKTALPKFYRLLTGSRSVHS